MYRWFLGLIVCLLVSVGAVGQTRVPCRYWVDSTSAVPVAVVVTTARFGPLPPGPIKARGNSPTVWLRFRLHNPHPSDTLRRLFFGGYHVDWTLTEQAGPNAALHTRRSGWLVQSSPDAGPDAFTLPIVVGPQQTKTIWFSTTGYVFVSAITPRLFTANGYRQYKLERSFAQRNHLIGCILIVGVCLFLTVFSMAQSLYSRDTTYGYWSFYLLSSSIFFVIIFDIGFNLKLIGKPLAAFVVSSQFLIQISYLLFLRSFLEVRKYLKSINRLISIIVVCLACSMSVTYWATLGGHIQLVKFLDQTLFLTDLLLLVIFIAVVRANVPHRNLFLIGSVGVLLLAAVASGINEIGLTNFDAVWTDPGVWFGLGVGFELLFFNLALSQRAHRTVQEKQQLEHDKQLEKQRVDNITEQFRQRTAQIEMSALRAQMNPHFIFNCLNSIQYFTAQNEATRASDYLTKFSRLIRLVLENSQSERVTLTNELETLQLYIEMEAMRFGQKVRYQIDMADSIDAESIQIPPLLLQPFVENAIWHGLMHKEEGGTVRITVQQPVPDRLRIIVADDGVGRAKAAEYKSKSATKHKSFGLQLTADRIALINQLYNTHTQVRVEDLTNADGYPTGTRVVVEIPI